MKNKNIPLYGAGFSLFALLALAACTQSTQIAALGSEPARASCEAVAKQKLPVTTLKVTYFPADTASAGAVKLPAHCQIDGTTNPRTGIDGKPYAIGFRLRLPDNWNGRLLFVGGGGKDGNIDTGIGPNVGALGNMTPALLNGYATVGTDGGHTGGTSSAFAIDPLSRIDHAYNAYDRTAVNAKSLIASRYGRAPDKSYFMGCSGGGRQGMMFTQKFPGHFDGVVVHAPAMRVSSGATVAVMWNNKNFSSIAPQEDGKPILSKAFTDTDLQLVSKSILDRCDALDGAKDGMVANVAACRYDPSVLKCAAGKQESCLGAPQVTALQKYFEGPKNSAGKALYTGFAPDAGIDQPGWRSWTLGSSPTPTPNSLYNVLMVDALRLEYFMPEDPAFVATSFNFDTDPARMLAESSIYDTYADDKLAAYKARGGKLMLVHGMADPIFSALDTLGYYDRLSRNNGGLEATQGFARTFLVPGETHCSGGRATDQFDALTAMVNWVENGKAPDRIEAAAPAASKYFPGRTRPLCAYPKFAKYNGTGNIEDAKNFSCVVN